MIDKIVIKIKCDYTGNEDEVQLLTPKINYMAGDVAEITYTFTIDYLGDIVEKFEAIRAILKRPDTVGECQLNELRRGHSLAFDLFTLIGKTIEELEKK